MKFILSRKGFDSQFGGHPSPIFNDGTMLSLPIPEMDSKGGACDTGKKFCDLKLRGFKANSCICHLDPDIRPELYRNLPEGWVPAFGQCGAAAAHLESHEVGPGDIFLFFGLFQKWNPQSGFSENPFHAIWGYLQIDKVLCPSEDPSARKAYPWHPHCHALLCNDKKRIPNLLYTGKPVLSLDGSIPGYGTFRFTKDSEPFLRLTLPDQQNLTHWRREALPWVNNGRANMTYHYPSNCYKGYFKAVCRGQEFVIEESQSEVAQQRFEILLSYRNK